MTRLVTILLFHNYLETKLWGHRHYSQERCLLRNNGSCVITAGRANKGLLQREYFMLRGNRSDWKKMETKEKWVVTFCRKSYQTQTYGDGTLKGLSRVLFFPLLLKKYMFTLENLETIKNYKKDTKNHFLSYCPKITTDNLWVHSF